MLKTSIKALLPVSKVVKFIVLYYILFSYDISLNEGTTSAI